MTPLTINGTAQFGWLYEPDWSQAITARFRFEAETVTGLTKRENRRPLGETLRVELDAAYLLTGAEAAAARNALRTLQDTPVRLPFWPGLDQLGYRALNWLAFDDGMTNPLVTTEWVASGREYVVPTLLGHLTEPPTFKAIDLHHFQVSVKWRESSPADEALGFVSREWATGPAIGALTPYQFPFIPDWSSEQDAGPVVVDVDRQALGFGRTWSQAAYPQLGYRKPTLGFTLTDDEPAQLLRFFLDRRGTAEAFWLPCWVSECRFVSAAGNQVTVTNAAALGDHRYVMLYDDEPIYRRVVAIDGNVLTLDSDPGVVLTDTTIICTLALARFGSGQLSLKWTAPGIAQAQIAFQEVSQEYLTPSGETGSTLGALPARCYLFEVRHGLEVWRWTNYERDLVSGGETYSQAGIDFDEITDGLAWDSTSCRLKLRSTSSNPLQRLLNRTATDRMELIVSEAVPGDPATGAAVIFRGWLTHATFNGPWIGADSTGFGSLFSRKVPRTLMQPTDNYALFDAGNRLAREDWTFTGTLAAAAGAVLTFDGLSWPGGDLPEILEHWFALGYVQSPDGRRIPIIDSAELDGESVTVTCAHAPITAPDLGEEWSLVPGYDGLATTADLKFGNLANFGGFPEVPEADPSLVPVKKDADSGGKK